MEKFSVLMTTYRGETPEYLDASLQSILINQSCKPNQFVLVVDGPIPENLDNVIKKYKLLFEDIVEVIYSPVNQGQSKASAIGFEYINNELFARMDSDDICIPNRFERQLEIFETYKDVSVVGGWIAEFDSDPSSPHSLRIVPEKHDEIIKTFRKKNPINNMTVMMKKSEVIKAGGYGRDTVNEDYSLYAHMWVQGAVFYNIQDVLCNARVGNNMVGRRNDFRIYKDWTKDQKYLVKNHKHSRFTAFISNCRCFFFVITPVWVKKILYKTVLRKKNKNGKK
ncbi:MAG: glycosyltransferase [Clostridia bacterium]|nr:glycosyltransferase [Clostridia bacterium]